MRYRPMAAAASAPRWFPDGATPDALARAPMVAFDREDDLQHRYLRDRLPGPARPPTHYVPSTADFHAAVGLGMGWGMLPDPQGHSAATTGSVVVIDDDGVVDVVLYWQQWKLRARPLDEVEAAVVTAAHRHLAQ